MPATKRIPRVKTVKVSPIVDAQCSEEIVQVSQDEAARNEIPLVKAKHCRESMCVKLGKLETLLASKVSALEATDRRQFKSILTTLGGLVTVASKTQTVKRATNPDKASGFNIPYTATDATYEFMGLPKDSLVSWAKLTSFASDYIKSNGLQSEANKKCITPDAALCKLLRYNPAYDPPLTWTSMQQLIPRCFTRFPCKRCGQPSDLCSC